jgi:hypothetical protein
MEPPSSWVRRMATNRRRFHRKFLGVAIHFLQQLSTHSESDIIGAQPAFFHLG